MQRDAVHLLDIVTAARLALDFAKGLNRLQFQHDLKTQASVIREIEIIGEATKRLSAEFREAHPQIPWQDIAGMRDVLIHAYDKVDVDELWYVLETSIPELISLIEPMLPRESEEGD